MLFQYKTEFMKELLSKNHFSLMPAYQDSIKTAEGFLVPYNNEIITSIFLPQIKKEYLNFIDDTSIKGNRAIKIVAHALKRGMVAFPFNISEVYEKELQLQGKDIIAISSFQIQVKCDWFAGPKEKGGTGNIYVQIRECNPKKKH